LLEGIFYLGSILLANILVHTFGLIQLWGVTFPAGAVVIGLTFTARDFVQKRWGKLGCWGWMFAASIITLLFNWKLAFASITAFLIAESIDWLIYTYVPLSFRGRIIASNLISTPLDSIVFVLLAFGPIWPAIWGQTIVKLLSSMVLLPLAKEKGDLTRPEVVMSD